MSDLSAGPGPLLRAVAFAANRHRYGRREGQHASPYVDHPVALANLLANEAGVDDPLVLCAALLHDTLEDTRTDVDELRAIFGPAVAEVVAEVSDDRSLERRERQLRQVSGAAQLSPAAKLVRLADLICNLRDILAAPPDPAARGARSAYFAWVEMVARGLRGTHARLEGILDGLLARRAELAREPVAAHAQGEES